MWKSIKYPEIWILIWICFFIKSDLPASFFEVTLDMKWMCDCTIIVKFFPSQRRRCKSRTLHMSNLKHQPQKLDQASFDLQERPHCVFHANINCWDAKIELNLLHGLLMGCRNWTVILYFAFEYNDCLIAKHYAELQGGNMNPYCAWHPLGHNRFGI